MFTLTSRAYPIRRTCVLFVATLTFVAALSLAVALNQAQALTPSQCITAFGHSSASSSGCELDSANTSGANCSFSGLCPHNSQWISTSITVTHGEASDLQNCSGSLALSC